MSRIDAIMSLALSGSRDLTSFLSKDRAAQEQSIAQSRDALITACDKAAQLRPAAEAQAEEKAGITAQLTTALMLALAQLPAAITGYTRARKETLAYKQRHSLNREPLMPNPWESGLLLGIFVALESLTNTGFFMNAYLAASPQAALLISFLLSLVNVVMSCTAGYFFLRGINYGRSAIDPHHPAFVAQRIKSILGMSVYLILEAFLLVTVGFVRSQESLESVTWGFAEFAILLASPEAIFLVIITACLALVSLAKGRAGFSDPYLYYSDYARAEEAAYEQILETFEDASLAIDEAFEDELGQHEDARAKQGKARKAYNKAVKDARAAHGQWRAACSEAQRAMEKTLSEYLAALQSGGVQATAEEMNTYRALCQFDNNTDFTLPDYLPDQTQSGVAEQLQRQRAKAMKQLTAAFEDFIKEEDKPS